VAEAAQQAEIARARRGVLTRPRGGAPDVVVAVDGCQVHLEDGWHEVKVGRAALLGAALRTDHRSMVDPFVRLSVTFGANERPAQLGRQRS